MKITLAQLSSLQNFIWVDVRTQRAYDYGHIPGAMRMEGIVLPQDRPLVLYCRNGTESPALAAQLREAGYDAYFLEGGYFEWLRTELRKNAAAGDRAAQAEQSIRTRFHKKLFSKFARAIVTYDLIRPNDRIAVCISGGKDSMLMAKLFQEIKRHNKFAFELVFLVMDPGYSRENREIIERNAALLDIPITVFETDIFENVLSIEKSPCYICARMRRGNLYAGAQALGCNKIALGHHYDDVIETILMGMLYGGQVQTMMPRLNSTNFKGMQLIRPMYFIREEDIIAWRDANGLRFIECACRFTESQQTDPNRLGKRQKVKQLIRSLRAEDPEIEQNIFKSVENVNLSTVLAYKGADGVRRSVLDEQ